MNKVQVNPDLDEVKLLKKVLRNLSRCRRQGLFMNRGQRMSLLAVGKLSEANNSG